MIIIVQFVVTSELCVSNIEVTVNTCTCTDAFTQQRANRIRQDTYTCNSWYIAQKTN